jgi:RNA polymerase sigma factor (sigma-70 family)
METNAFEKILDEHKDRVFSYAFYVLGNREDAEDVTQDVFIRLWRNLGAVDSSRRKAWIMSVAHNRCIDLARSRKRTVHRREDPDVLTTHTDSTPVSPEMHPELRSESRETRRMLLGALRKLPVRTRSMIVMHYYQGMKYRSIGEVLGVNVNTVKVEVHRARKQLREFLAREFHERTENV